MNSIETLNLTHQFSNHERALDEVNLQVQQNSIYGFLGPNGAGKTTTLKLILGLLKKQHGEILVFGKPFAKHRVETLRQIGSMIESPSIYGHLTAVENLKILQRVYDCPERRIQEVLEFVSLQKTGNKKTSAFSLGMKQRLSIAIALLHQPSLLILDEPTNGLDPNGMIEIRELLQELNQKLGITILVSSHLLNEIEKFVTHVGIINRGNLLFQGTLGELVSKQKQHSYLVFETGDNEKALQVISAFSSILPRDNGTLATPILDKKTIAAINQSLVTNHIDVYGISRVESDLEKIFFDVISE